MQTLHWINRFLKFEDWGTIIHSEFGDQISFQVILMTSFKENIYELLFTFKT